MGYHLLPSALNPLGKLIGIAALWTTPCRLGGAENRQVWALVGANTDPLGSSQCQGMITGALVTLCLYMDELGVVQAQHLVSFSFLACKQSDAWQEEEELK